MVGNGGELPTCAEAVNKMKSTRRSIHSFLKQLGVCQSLAEFFEVYSFWLRKHECKFTNESVQLN